MQRIELLRSSLEDLIESKVTLHDGELCLISSDETGYNSLIIGDGTTKAVDLPRITLNRNGGCGFLGIADLTTDPGKPLGSGFYLTSSFGTYDKFAPNIEVEKGEVAILLWKYEAWSKIRLFKQDLSELDELKNKVVYGVSLGGKLLERDENGNIIIPVDDKLSSTSENPIKNKAVSKALDWYEGD